MSFISLISLKVCIYNIIMHDYCIRDAFWDCIIIKKHNSGKILYSYTG